MKIERYSITDITPLLAVIVPVHNQEEIIASNLNALLNSLTLPFEIVIVNDCSNDGTRAELKKWSKAFKTSPPSNACSIEIVETRRGKFETWCDKEAILRTTAPYIIEVQADMNIMDKGFDARLLMFMNSNSDLIALSGRGVEPFIDVSTSFKYEVKNTLFRGLDFGMGFFIRESVIAYRTLARRIHSFTQKNFPSEGQRNLSSLDSFFQEKETEMVANRAIVFPEYLTFRATKRAGWLGDLLEKYTEDFSFAIDQIWVGETIMRGPLIIDRSKYLQIGGFNTDIFFLGYDDHDLARRAWITHGYRVGFHPVNFTSPLSHGSTRKKKSIVKKYLLAKKRARMSRRSNKSFLLSHADIFKYKLPSSEIRILE